jgi:protease-4
MTDSERKIIQHSVEKVYDTFTKHVADGRGMKQSDVDSIGQGRVWSAISAKQIGLVDVYGGLNDAVKIAAKKVKLDNYRIKELPEQKENILSKLINGLNDGDETKILQKELGENYRYYNSIKQLMKQKGVQAWFPYDICVE